MEFVRHRETREQAEGRLLKVIASAQLHVFEHPYTFETLSRGEFPDRASPSALAYVRDGEVWSQLVAVRPGHSPRERYTIFSFHIDAALDASGFVGWLASHPKRTVGTGVIVIRGKDRRGGEALYVASQGVFDYWGCPAHLGDAVVAEVQALVNQGRALVG